jgi:uncharacterized protein
MKFRSAIAAILILCCLTACVRADEPAPIKTLIVDGAQQYHKYLETTPVLKETMEASGRFTVDVLTSTVPDGDDTYRPAFEEYDLVVVNEGFGASPWPRATEEAFEEYVAGGGGVVVYHAANNSWPDWEEYNKMSAVGGWGGRNESSGPYLYLNEEGEPVRDDSPGKGGGHGAQREYEIRVCQPKHPIMQGLPETFLHGPDELYAFLRGPAENVTILASAHSRLDNKGSGREEPMLMVIEYGEGRVFHTVLGHHVSQIQEGSFVTTLLRGAEWAATGEVTVPIPEDFPNQEYPPTGE